MKVKVVVLPDGKISAFVEQGSYPEGKAALEKLLAALTGENVEFDDIGQIEQHRHDAIKVENTVEVHHGHEH